MSLSLPGNNLYYLPRDNLAPEKYEEIVNPLSAWPQIKSEYVFDDSLMPGFQLINMRRRDFHGYTCLLYTSPSPRDATLSRMPSSA